MYRTTPRQSSLALSSAVNFLGLSKLVRVLGQADPLFSLTAFVIVLSLVLGGGTRGGFLADAILQALAIPLLLVCLWKMFEFPLSKQARVATWFCLAVAAVPLIQLVPLPPWLWTVLPGRELAREAFDLVGAKPSWMPLSVSPRETWLSALSLIPAVGIFLATLMLGYRERRLLSLVVIAVGVLSVFIGLIQVAQGPQSPLRFFEFTNDTEAVGFFANRNHFAALLYAVILFTAAWAINAAAAGSGRSFKDYDALLIVAIVGTFTILVVLLAGQAMARSRAGLGLTIIALGGAFALGISDRRVRSTITPIKLLGFASALAAIFAAQYALYRIMERFVIDPLEDARLPFASNTIKAAFAYLPFGSGLGSFVPVYATFERPEHALADTYANHAHNDLLELWLTSGVMGLLLMWFFVAWLVLRSVEIWRRAPEGANELDWSLARAATIVVALLAVHSFFDYPLRTGAMMAIMAFACGLLIEPAAGQHPRQTPPVTAKKHQPSSKRGTSRPTTPMIATKTESPEEPSDASPLSPDRLWGTNLEWPKEWSAPPKSGPQGDKE